MSEFSFGQLNVMFTRKILDECQHSISLVTLTLISSMRFSRSVLDLRSTGFSISTLMRRRPFVTSSSILTLSGMGLGPALPVTLHLKKERKALGFFSYDFKLCSYFACCTSRNFSRSMIWVRITTREMLPCLPWVSSTKESPFEINVAASGAINSRRSSLTEK